MNTETKGLIKQTPYESMLEKVNYAKTREATKRFVRRFRFLCFHYFDLSRADLKQFSKEELVELEKLVAKHVHKRKASYSSANGTDDLGQEYKVNFEEYVDDCNIVFQSQQKYFSPYAELNKELEQKEKGEQK